jgi:hypothetical protein
MFLRNAGICTSTGVTTWKTNMNNYTYIINNLLPFNYYIFRKTDIVTVTVTFYGVVLHMASHILRPLLIYCASPSEL